MSSRFKKVGVFKIPPLPEDIRKEYAMEKEDAPKRAELAKLSKSRYLKR